MSSTAHQNTTSSFPSESHNPTVNDRTEVGQSTGAAYPSHRGRNDRGERGSWGGNRRGRGSRGRGAGTGPASAAPRAARPTHFLSLPLHTFPDLRTRIAQFQDALFVSPPPVSSSSLPASNDSLPSPSLRAPQPTNKAKGKRTVKNSSLVEGLDSSIVIDPRRMHMTLGVMALELDNAEASTTSTPTENPQLTSASHPESSSVVGTPPTPNNEPSTSTTTSTATSTRTVLPASADPTMSPIPPPPRKTVSSALALLRSLQPYISTILDGEKGVEVPLEMMHALKTSRITPPRPKPASAAPETPKAKEEGEGMKVAEKERRASDSADGQRKALVEEKQDKIGAGVLFVGPKDVCRDQETEARRKLREVCALIHDTFKRKGYITETRPLKLHCTILNTSHRKSSRRIPFAYTDILASGACSILRGTTHEACDDHQSGSPPLEQGLLSSTPSNVPPVPTITTEYDTIPDADLDPNNFSSTPMDLALPDININDTSSTTNKAWKELRYQPPMHVPPPLPVDLGTYRVEEVQLWVMGSHGRNNEYVSCGGVHLE